MNAPLNAVVADAGFVDQFGRRPNFFDSERTRIRAHLTYVIEQLRSRTPDISKPAAKRRQKCLRLLEHYRDAGQFPRNTHRPGRTPVFIDRGGRLCAVGHLVAQTAGRAAAETISAHHRLDYIEDIDPERVDDWAAHHGFSRNELAMIQPTYSGDPIYSALTTAHYVFVLFCLPFVTAWFAVAASKASGPFFQRVSAGIAGLWGMAILHSKLVAESQQIMLPISMPNWMKWETAQTVAQFGFGTVLVVCAAIGLFRVAGSGERSRPMTGVAAVFAIATIACVGSIAPFPPYGCPNGADKMTYRTNLGHILRVIVPGPGTTPFYDAMERSSPADAVGTARFCPKGPGRMF